jgi:hypothetical protein
MKIFKFINYKLKQNRCLKSWAVRDEEIENHNPLTPKLKMQEGYDSQVYPFICFLSWMICLENTYQQGEFIKLLYKLNESSKKLIIADYCTPLTLRFKEF